MCCAGCCLCLSFLHSHGVSCEVSAFVVSRLRLRQLAACLGALASVLGALVQSDLRCCPCIRRGWGCDLRCYIAPIFFFGSGTK